MSYLLRDPTTALAVSPIDDGIEYVRGLVLDGTATDVTGVTSVDAAGDVLADDRDVGCVVVTDGWGDASLPSVCRDLGAESGPVPVVALASDGSERLAHETVRAGAFDYVPRSVADDALVESVDDAIATFTERRERAEESDVLTAMFHRMSIPMYVKDTEGRYLRSAYMAGEMRPEEAVGKTDLEVHGEHGEDARRTYEDDLRVVAEDEAIRRKDEVLHTPDGEYWSRTTKIPWYDDDGSVKGLIGISHDVTDDVVARRRLEEHEAQFEEFTSHVSHEIRTPLQVATGSLELARETGDEEAFEKVARALDRIDDILDDVRTLAKANAAQTTSSDEAYPPQFGERTDLAAVVSDIWSVVGVDDAVLDVDVPSDAWINAPGASVRPILENLFKNAIVHTGPDVRIRAGLTNDGFYVEDDGPGIPAERRGRVFEDGYTTGGEGSGTGLSIVAATANQYNWDLTVTDGRDGGARIEVGNCLVVSEPPEDRSAHAPVSLQEGERTHVGGDADDCFASYDDATDQWTVTGSGVDIWRGKNEFCFVHRPIDGGVRIQGRVTGLTDVSPFTKGGFMVRGSLDEDAPYGYVGLTPGHGTEVLWRQETGENGVSQHLEEEVLDDPWYRLDRVGDEVTLYRSTDGTDWQPIDQRHVDLCHRPHIGLVVCSHVPDRDGEARFDDVSVERLNEA